MMVLTSIVEEFAEGKHTACSDGEENCSCKFDCSDEELAPVCGMDGKTHDNECALSLLECKTGKTISILYKGECKKYCEGVKCSTGESCIFDQDGLSYCIKSDCDKYLGMTCPNDGKKVCGLDNQTYNSDCHRRQAGCKSHKIILKRYKGSCEGSKTCSDVQCGTGSACVMTSAGKPRCIECCSKLKPSVKIDFCGSDGKTYKSWCELRAASCRTGRMIEVVDLDLRQEDCPRKAAQPKS